MRLDTTLTDLANSVDETTERVAERTPSPVDALVRRAGAIQAESLRQTGRISVTAANAIRELANTTWSGVTDVARSASAALDSSTETLRTTGRRVLGDARQATSTVSNRARSAAEDVERSIGSVTDRAERTGARVKSGAEDSAGEVVKAVDTGAAQTAKAGATTPTGPYQNWTKDELYDRAVELDIGGRSGMTKAQLVKALRKH